MDLKETEGRNIYTGDGQQPFNLPTDRPARLVVIVPDSGRPVRVWGCCETVTSWRGRGRWSPLRSSA
jgi:hypothetical protein